MNRIPKDLSSYVEEDFGPVSQGPAKWPARFQAIVDQGLTGKWIDASQAFGLGKAVVPITRAAEREGWDVDAVQRDHKAYIKVNKPPARKGAR